MVLSFFPKWSPTLTLGNGEKGYFLKFWRKNTDVYFSKIFFCRKCFFKKLFELNAMRRTKCSNCMQFRSRNFQQFPKFSEESQISVTKFPKNQKLQIKFIVAKIQPFRTFWNFLETQNLWISDNFGNAATALCTFSKMLEIFRQKFPNFRNFGISATEICTFKIECWKYFNRNLQIFETGNIATDICALIFAIKIGTHFGFYVGEKYYVPHGRQILFLEK